MGLKKLLHFITYRLYSLGDSYKRAARADDAYSFIWDFQDYLRSQWKYAETPHNIDQIYEKWFEELNEHGINLDELWR